MCLGALSGDTSACCMDVRKFFTFISWFIDTLVHAIAIYLCHG
jgi:hypothetical protein